MFCLFIVFLDNNSECRTITCILVQVKVSYLCKFCYENNVNISFCIKKTLIAYNYL